MFKVIKFIIVLGLFLGIAYFTFTVPLGKKTLWQHLVGISHTDEAQTLQSELKRKLETTKKDLSRELTKQATKIAVDNIDRDGIGSLDGDEASGARARVDGISKADKRALKKMIESKSDKEPSREDRAALNRLLRQKNLDQK